MNLTLIGYRGSGKSTLARLLSNKLGWICLDTDLLIEKQTGQTVATIFRTRGETTFREIEAEIIQSLPSLISPGQNTVIATGGGSVLSEENRRVFQALGTVVWLTASPDTLARRLTLSHGSGSAKRPLLAGLTAREEIDALLPLRLPYYALIAQYTIDTSQLTVDEALQQFSHVFSQTSEK